MLVSVEVEDLVAAVETITQDVQTPLNFRQVILVIFTLSEIRASL